MSFAELAQREMEEAETLAAAAAAIGRGAISRTLATAAKLAVERVQENLGRGEIGEAAADLRAIRSDVGLWAARGSDLAGAEIQAAAALLDALKAGYEYDAWERSKLTEQQSTGLKITVDIALKDLSDLKHYPIHGRTAMELALRLRAMLSDAIDETLAMPLTGRIDASVIPAQLGEVARLHGERLANGVREAYFAGVQAATRALGRALIGA